MGAQCGRTSARRPHRLGGAARAAHRFLLPPGSVSPCRARAAAAAAEAPLTLSYANPPRTSLVSGHGPSATVRRWPRRSPAGFPVRRRQPTTPASWGPRTTSCAALATSEQILLGEGHRAVIERDRRPGRLRESDPEVAVPGVTPRL